MNSFKRIIILSIVGCSILSLSSNTYAETKNMKSNQKTASQLTYIDTETIPYQTKYKGASIGGLSGIDYDPKSNTWLMISDDRSEKDYARFYEAHINYNKQQFNHIKFTQMHYLKQPDKTTYPNKNDFTSESNHAVADPESIRVNPLNNHQILYTSEGDRELGLNPFIRIASKNGDFISEIPIHTPLKMDHQNKQGFRNNLALEGSTFTEDGKHIWASMEAPIIQDDQLPTTNSGSHTRLTQYNRQGDTISEIAYPLDAIPQKPGKNKEAENGIAEILMLNEKELLILERASVQNNNNQFKNDIRIYKADVTSGTNIKNMNSIQNHKISPVKKHLIANLNEQDVGHIDNIEGMTFGPKLPNGHDILVLISDNNFNNKQQTNLIAFDVEPTDEK